MPELFDFHHFPILETDRLRLRQMTRADLPALHAIFGDAETCRYFLDQNAEPYATIEQTEAQVYDWATRQFELQHGLRWGLTLKSNPAGDALLIGTAGYNYWNRAHRRGEIGYDLNRAYWQRGLMTEAIHGILRWGFAALNLHRIEADVTGGNVGSVRVLEKCGFKQDGCLRQRWYLNGQFYDHLLFGLLRADYEGMQS
ncbi:MAG: GNAT family N-acetyltransferase [Anaerolineae bacterium]|nr:GNAT family N-acetyltransferase [Anaerolineae bacterium]